MKPNKNIPIFCFESPWLKPFNLNLDSVEPPADTRVTPTWAEALIDMGINELIHVEPLFSPQGNLLYYDFQFQNITDPIVYGDGSWSYENSFESVIGIKSEIKQHKII
jgi:hypothetical protein